MDPFERIACAHLPALPLQALRRDHPEWSKRPVVVVDSDRSSARITFASRLALASGVSIGMRYATAQSLIPGLCADVVGEERLVDVTDELVRGLLRITPRVEASRYGTFFIDSRGMHGLYDSIDRWATDIHRYLCGQRYRATLVVGFGRERVAAIARTTKQERIHLLEDESAEKALASKLPLAAFGASVELVSDLRRLGIVTSHDLAKLPPLELAMRFGQQALELQNRTTGRVVSAFSSAREVGEIRIVLEMDPPDDDLSRLLFGLKRLFDSLAARLRERGEELVTMSIGLVLERAATRVEKLEPARPGLDVASWLELIRLRLERESLSAKVRELSVECESTRAHGDQLELLRGGQARDLDAAARALARLAALFGPENVTRLELRDAHLPEASFVHVPTTTIAAPTNVGTGPVLLVRRRNRIAKPLAGTRVAEEHQPFGKASPIGRAVRWHGPVRVSGGWWAREVMRDYYFVETADGAVLWVYRDGARKRWFQHGELD